MRPFLLAIAWLGALGALSLGRPLLAGAVAAATVGVSLTVYRDRRSAFLALAVLGVMALAWLRWQAATAPPPPDSVAWWADGTARTLTGRIDSEPEVQGATLRFTVAAATLTGDAGPASVGGDIQVRVAASRPLRNGDLVRLQGRLRAPPLSDDFDYRTYLARRGIYATMDYPRLRVMGHRSPPALWRWLSALHEHTHGALWDALPAPEAALAEGILLGRRSDIPRDLNDEFARAGVSHLIVISGFNIALVGGMVVSATGWLLGRRRAGALALAVIGLYSVFVGLSPPVARAAVMGAMAVLAMLSGRPYGAGAALVFAAAALSLQDPRILEDVSFQLSFAATAGLLVLGPPLIAIGQRVFAETRAQSGPSWRSLGQALWDTLAVTLAASVAATPILLVNFGRLSVIAPLGNLVLVPLFPAVLVLGALGLAVALVLPAAGAIALAPLGGLLAFCVGFTRLCAAAPGASLNVSWFGAGAATAVYAALGLAALGRLPRPRTSWTEEALHLPVPLRASALPMLAITPAALVLLALAPAMFHAGAVPHDTRVTVLNIGGMPVTLVELAGGGRVLVDTGPAPNGARAALDRLLPVSDRTLDAVVITRDLPAADAGLAAVAEQFGPRLVLVPPEAANSGWVRNLSEQGVGFVALQPGLTVGNATANVEVTPALTKGAWTVTVKHGAHQIALGGGPADAGIERAGRDTAVYARVGSDLLRVDLTHGANAVLTTDGTHVRLRPPAGQPVRFERCAVGCLVAGAGRE